MSIGPEPGRDQTSVDVERAQEPLTDRELEMVKRMFSDPFAIPIEFYAWLKAKMESDPPLLTTASIFGFRAQLAATIEATATSFPVGAIVDYGGSTDPDAHWMICDGRAISQATYAVLFGRIGHTYGADPGGGNFIIPDFRGRVAVGKGSHTDIDALGENEGVALANRSVKHSHVQSREVVSLTPGATAFSITGTGASVDGPETAEQGRVVNSPAFLVVNKVIKVD